VTQTLVAYADLAGDAVIQAAAHDEAGLDVALFSEPGGLRRAVAQRIVRSQGPFARAARRGPLDAQRLAVASRELDYLASLAQRRGDEPAGPIDGPHASMVETLLRTTAWAGQATSLAAFHVANGVGDLATHRVLRFAGGGLHGIAQPDPVTLSDLEAGEELRADLISDLAAFVSGQPANDALLYGPPGTGKSVTVRACAAAFAGHGLRLVQAGRDEMERIDDLFGLVAGAGPPCLVFLDDLVFDDASRADRALRAALEGSVIARPANVLVWATSNRLNLTHQTHSERADEVDAAEARGEKTALADRFGRRVRFAVNGEEWYLAIVERLLRERYQSPPTGWRERALRYTRAGAAPTARAARHFAASWQDGASG
jgi:uncharacterized protein